MRADDAKRLKELERENGRLKRIVADRALEVRALKEIAKGRMSLLCQWFVAICGVRRRVCLSGAGYEVGGVDRDRGGGVLGVDVVVRARVLIGVGGAEEFPDAAGEVAFEAVECFFA